MRGLAAFLTLIAASVALGQPEPPGGASPIAGATIVIDPSHALRGPTGEAIDAGNQGPGGLEEQEVVLSVAVRLRTVIEAAGARALLTRTPARPWRQDTDVQSDSLARGEMANQSGAAAFIRLHCDASTDRTTRGCRVTYYREGALELAKAVLDNLAQSTGSSRLGVFQRHEFGLDVCKAPGISVNLGIISNAQDERLLSAEAYQQRAAEGIFAGLEQAMAGGEPAPEMIPAVEDPEPALERAMIQASEALLEDVLSISNRTPSHIGFVARNLDTGEACWIRGDTSFRATQLIGLPIMAELTRELREGTIQPTSQPPGSQRTVLQLLQAMIVNGEAAAGDALIDYLGMDDINSTASLLGMAHTHLRHKLGAPTAPGQPGNETSPGDVAHVLEQIAVGQGVSGEASQAMYAILMRHGGLSLIRQGVPAEAEVAHLSGSEAGFVADTALVRAPHGTYVLTVFFRDVDGSALGPEPQSLIPEISQAVYDHFARTYLWVETEPPGARVRINDHLKGRSPCLIQATSATLEPQEFTISADTDSGGRASAVVTVRQGDRQAVELTLD